MSDKFFMEIEKQYDKIYRYCYFKVRNRETAEDITQEAFLRYFGKANVSKDKFNLPYLYTIARNLCIDEYRKSSTECFDEINELSDTKDKEHEIITSVSVRNAMKHLNEDERELLLLRYVNELKISDIAKLYNISRSAVYRRLTHAENKFKEYYE